MSDAPATGNPRMSLLAAALILLFTVRVGLSVTAAPAAATSRAAARVADARADARADAAAAPPEGAAAPSPSAPGPSAPRSQESRYVTDGRYQVREISGSIPAGATRLRVDTQIGSVRLHPASGRDLGYRIRVRAPGRDAAEARRRLDRMTVGASREGTLLAFTGSLPGAADARRGLGAEFDVEVPADMESLEVTTGAGDVEAIGVPGRVSLRTLGGTLVARDLVGFLDAETRGGPIVAASLRSGARLVTAGGEVRIDSVEGDLVVRSSGGDVRIGRAGGAVQVETGGGNVQIAQAGSNVRVATSGGGIDVDRAGGRVTAASAGGGIRVGSATGGVQCETGAGPIVLRSLGGPIRAVTSSGSIRALLGGEPLGGDSDLQTWQGDVVVSLPDTLPVTIRALVDNPVGNSIASDFPVTILRDAEGEGRPLEVGEARIGGGGPVLKLRTQGGRITILKVKAHEAPADGDAGRD